MTPRVAIYARTNQIDQNTEFVNQVKKCNNYIQKNGWNLCEIYFDEGTNAVSIDRPELSSLTFNAAKGRFDLVLVSDLDRLSLSLKDLLEIRQILSDFNVKISSTIETENAELLSKNFKGETEK